jgi:hypothetical protein
MNKLSVIIYELQRLEKMRIDGLLIDTSGDFCISISCHPVFSSFNGGLIDKKRGDVLEVKITSDLKMKFNVGDL